MKLRCLSMLLVAIILGACSSNPEAVDISQKVNVRDTITPGTTHTIEIASASTVSVTFTVSPTPTRTPSPTPTAPTIGVTGNPRAYTLFDPIRQPGAPCGWVDTLDFPLDPPDGMNARGGDDFGRFRSRYEKYHAGEDWGLSNRSNFGTPVYSIGHGQVTYAQPLGWGPDKGVVIVRHTFPDGRSILSFYGHLDPPTVILKEGDCLQRGDVVGQIGRPRTPPHLHLEVRSHLPYATGSGYWPNDPADAGWLPPSQTINQYRLKVVPGALWMTETTDALPLGSLDSTTFLTILDDKLVGVDLQTGVPSWSFELSDQIRAALSDLDRKVLYVYDTSAGLLAYPLNMLGDLDAMPETLTPLWERELPSSSHIDLMPLPGGGLLVNDKDKISAFSSDGDFLWEEAGDGYLVSMSFREDVLFFTTFNKESPLKSVDLDGLYIWEGISSGIPLVSSGDRIWFYAEDGLYNVDLAHRSIELVHDLPKAQLRRSTAVTLSNGGVLLLHTDTADRRLLAFDENGDLLWEFSIPIDGDPQLFELDDTVYLLTQPSFSSRGVYRTMEVFEVDPEQEKLLRIFESGSRRFNARNSWVFEVGDHQLLIDIAGVGSLLFEPRVARERMGR